MWGRMKSLECKYIDLANFYKKELLNKSTENVSAVGGVVQQTMTESRSGLDTRMEDSIINELKNEKIKFEQNIKNLVSGDDTKILLSNSELIRFNKELVGAFQDIIE